MSLSLRVCLFSRSGLTDKSFSEPFKQLGDLQIVAECSDWQELQAILHARRVDAVAVNLDSDDTDASPYIVERIAEVAPGSGILGVSQNAHPDTIIAAMRAGCSQFVRWPIDPQDLKSAINRMRQTAMPAAMDSQRICVVGSSGGVGATTIACNLAIELAHATGQRCGLVDMDLQYGDVSCSFDVTPRYSISDVCRTVSEIDRTLLESALEELPCDVSILAGPQQVDLMAQLTPDGVEQMLHVMAQMLPFVVIDLPRTFSPATAAALSNADRVLIITQLAIPFLRNATRIYEGLLQMGANEDHLSVVLNRSNANFERIKPDEVEKHFGRPIFAVIPNDYKHIGTSRDLGHPIVSDAPNSPARRAIQEIARRLASKHLSEENLPTSRGLFGLFRKRHPKALRNP